MIGGVNYSQLPEIPAQGLRNEVNSPSKTSSFFGRSELAYLPETVKEVDTISSLLLEKRLNFKKMTGRKCSEEFIKLIGSTGPSYSILHIASHGFYFPNTDEEYSVDKSMLRSGVFLSGAQNLISNGQTFQDREDGVLTAYEISSLDLKKTKLAVLSACSTGLGKIVENEGVFGLQRAFKLAGVEKLVLSLWKVDDTATQYFMTSFYSLMVEGRTVYEAFKDSQKMMKASAQFSNPFYWSAFILLE